ncbi:cation efflux protein [Dipodascopsis tothii]|uniref:cation efflux protein n=1 Tax=Dipodascopsis tothii TaxID=44089 RepID=UPI0034D007A7
MGFGKQERLISLLVLDTVFFLIEVVVGYAVHSLALVADSFHMLNDVFSLIVALWAVRVSSQRGPTTEYSYGWQRAEILGALVNGVFLLALCLTIFLEALQRFVEPQEITNPQLILFVGCMGLLSNLVGLLLFHEHGHSHGGGGHGHSHGSSASTPRLSRNNSTSVLDVVDPSAEELEIESLMPESVVQRQRREQQRAKLSSSPADYTSSHGHSHDHGHSHGHDHDDHDADEATGLLADYAAGHEDHLHSQPKMSKQQEQSLNMRGVFLHVMGDALGNVGVIGTALFIWLTDYTWRFYFDPIVSLVITCIIFSSALPLVKSASKILLQAVPKGINMLDVRNDILSLPGVHSVHDFHIWILKENLFIASLHVSVDVTVSEYMPLSQKIRQCLHGYGIHSATIQPEFTSGAVPPSDPATPHNVSAPASLHGDKAFDNSSCACVDGCDEQGCCPPSPPPLDRASSTHSHSH